MYAADAPAELTLSAGDGCAVYYTLDGSEPRVNGETATKLTGSVLEIQPQSNTDHTVTVKAVAEKGGKISGVTEKTVQFVKIPAKTSGTRVYLGKVTDGGVAAGPYDISIRVTTTDGKITRVEDNGTIDALDWENDDVYTDYAFWEGCGVMDTDGMPAKLFGKTLSDLLNMQTVPDDDDHNVDAVSGATVWSDAIRHAAIAALRSTPVSESESTVLAPALSAEDDCAPNKSYKHIDVAMSAAEGTTIRYTLDSTEPTESSTAAAKIGYSGDIGVRLQADPDTYPDGQIIEVRAAAFDADGNKSDTVRRFYVFANAKEAAYTAQLGGVSATVDGITVTAVIRSPNYDSKYYITSLSLDQAHSEEYADFLPELFSRIYLAQTTENVQPVSGYETESTAVLQAVQAALDQAAAN